MSILRKLARLPHIPLPVLWQLARRRLRGAGQFRVRHYCPICRCGWPSAFFRTGWPKPFALTCTACSTHERHRLLWLALDQRLAEDAGGDDFSVLHFAPEPGLRRELERRYGRRYITADLMPGRAKRTMDITAIDFPDASFDVTVCSHLLEHVPDDRRALAELYRTLKPGGTAFLMFPVAGDKTDEDPSVTDPAERERRFRHPEHVRIYGLADARERIMEAGFSVSTFRAVDLVPRADLRRLMALDPFVPEDPDYLFVAVKG